MGVGVIAVTLIAVVLIAVWLARSLWDRGSSVQGEPDRPRIVVLPFENFGPSDHAYFADGMTEEITSRLAAVQGLVVISRKSAVHYAQSDKTIAQIGRELDVGFVLEGTVRWAPGNGERNRVRITPQLIRVDDDSHLWAQPYDEVLDDVFEIQSLIAQKVAQALGVVLQDRDLAALEVRPTGNLDAYHAYLRGLHYAGQPHFTAANHKQALESFEQAVSLDPVFAKAWARLSRVHSAFHYYQVDSSAKRALWAKEAADRAFDLAPDEPATRLALGYYYYHVEKDWQSAFEEFSQAARRLPDNAEVMQARGALLQSMGRWHEAQDLMQRAVEMNPRDPSLAVELAFLYFPTRQYERALELSDRAIEISMSPGSETWAYLAKAFVDWCWRGATPVGREALEHVPLEHDFAVWSWYWQEMYEGRYEQAIARLDLAPEGWIRNKIAARPAPLLAGLALDVMGESSRSRDAYAAAREILERAIADDPGDPRLHASLGIAYAALGRKKEAIREGKRAVELYPLSRDAFYGIPYALDLAFVYTLVNEQDAACDQLKFLLSVPSWVSVPFLTVDPRWDRLRDHPRFRALLANSDLPTP
jgi:serine/threonine-protein kinase